jgi:AcrR family transcriptional regulator
MGAHLTGTGNLPRAALDGHQPRAGRPRSLRADRAILDAARDLIIEDGFAHLRLEHVAARAGVGKATIYRRWRSKEALALDVLLELAAPYLAVEDVGDTGAELRAAVDNAVTALTETSFGPVIRALLSQIAVNPALGDPFRATVVEARRGEVGRVLARGIERGDLRPDADPTIATELLVGPVYFRLMFGGDLDESLSNQVVRAFLQGHAAGSAQDPPGGDGGSAEGRSEVGGQRP